MILLALIISSGTVSYLLLFTPQNQTAPPQEVIIEPHPYNNLNWWDIAEEIASLSELLEPLGKIAGFGNRYMKNPNTHYYTAASYLIDRLNDLGIETDYVGTHYSVLGHQRGYGTDKRAIVFGAHLDSDESGIGVQQNAGGCAVVSAIASILSQFRLPIDIYYGFFSYNTVFLDDQQQLRAMWGSKDVAQYLKDNGVKVIAYYNFDELLYVDPLQDPHERLLAEYNNMFTYGYHETKYLADLLVAAMQRTGMDVMSSVQDWSTQTDHWSFWHEGFPAINVRGGHTIDPENAPADVVSSTSYDKEQALNLAKAAASVAVYLGLKGNGHETSFKLKQTLEPKGQAFIRTVISNPQTLKLSGSKSINGTVRISFHNGTNTLYGPIEISEQRFSIQTPSIIPLGPLYVQVTNLYDEPVDIELYLNYTSDTDGDGTLDKDQYSWPEPNPPLDWDHDLLPDDEEKLYGTDIFISDTDSDSIADGVEVMYGMDPLRDDTLEDLDHDGLNNIRELMMGLDPSTNDTDGDAMDDYWEVTFLTNPLVNDSAADYDNDTLTNYQEYIYGSDPWSSDGDFDGVPDVEEVARGMNPLSDDTDNDGLRDQLELIDGLDPLIPDYDVDLAPDGYDHNPKINTIIIILLISIVPISIGTVIFWRKMYHSNN